MEALAQRVIFRGAELQAVGVSLTELEPFVSDMHAFAFMGAQSIGSTDLERRPLVRFEDDFILAVPAAISLAIRRYVLEQLSAWGQLTNFSQHLAHKQLLYAVFHGLEAFGATPIKPELPTTAAELPAFQQTFSTFDEGKYAHLVVLYDSLHRAHAEGITSLAQCPPALVKSLADYLGECAKTLASQTGYSGGLTIVVFGGIGRAATVGLPNFPHRWHWLGFGLPDFLRLGGSEGISLLKLWKLCQQQETLRGHGIRFGNINGHLNLYSYWQRQGYCLIPKECQFASVSLAIGTDFIAEFRHSLRRAYDEHSVLRGNPGEWIKVERIHPAPMFAEQLQSSYANKDEAIEKVLHGVVETSARGWWLLSKQQQSDGTQRSIQLQVWDAILTWLEPLARELEREITTLPAGPVHVELIIQDLDRWEGSAIPPLSSDLSKDVDADRRIVTLTVPMNFLALFGQPTNIAERTILESLVEAVGDLSGLSLSSATIAAIVRRVLPDEDTRCFHMFRARNYRDFMLADAWPKPKPRFVRDEDVAFGRIGLAWAVLEDRTQRKINGAAQSQDFLNGVVDVLWQRTITRVKQINRCSLMHRCLTNIDATELDHRQWESTAKAFLAAHGRHEEVTNAAQERDTQRNMALMASRILIEMAICESPMGGGRTVNTEDLDACAAEVQVLIETASQSDILNSGLSGETPRITLHPNGQFDVPNTFYNEVLRPYLSGNFRTGFLAAAESARANYAAAEDENAHPVPLDPDFVRSFEVEFGVTPTTLFSIVDCLEEVGRIKGTIYFEVIHAELSSILRHGTGISQRQIDTVLDRFSLFHRRAWNICGAGFTIKDIEPWGFGRRLSLIARPFIKVSDEADGVWIIHPALIRDYLVHSLSEIYAARYRRDYFTTAAMRRWTDGRSNSLGLAFNDTVADEFRKLGWQARASVKMHEFGAPSQPDLGDVDVIAWSAKGHVFAAECKRLKPARNPTQIVHRLKEFRGEIGDDLSKHVRRFRWLASNTNNIRKVLGMDSRKMRLKALLITNTTVPMQYMNALPIPASSIGPVTSLDQLVATNLSN
jgi:hypothetical protein